MNLSQKLELRKLMAPELKQSLKILTLPLLDLKTLVDEELVNNPFLEESPANEAALSPAASYIRPSRSIRSTVHDEDFDPFAQLANTPSLQEVLLQQLQIGVAKGEEYRIGVEIIGNIDDNGYLTVPLAEIASSRRVPVEAVERALKVIQKFDPLGVGARTIPECLLIQCEALGENDPLVKAVIEHHLSDVAERKYALVAKELKTSVSEVESCVKKIANLNPKPGQKFSHERSFHIIPDIFIDEKDGGLEIFINQESIPSLHINEEYRNILKHNNLSPDEKEYLKTQLQNALELLRAIARRRGTLRKVLEVIAGIQKEAILSGLSHLKPLTLQEVADKIGMHESTVCRVVLNKYAETPQGIIALKDFFTSRVQQENGAAVSSHMCKDRISELISSEDKRHPLSDEDLAGILLKANGIKLARRTIAKYREELHLPSSTLRRER
jgi:RNA polymerase sigma-54 factor